MAIDALNLWATQNNFAVFKGGFNAPIGTFLNLRTMAYFQQASDGTLPADGNEWTMVSTNGSLAASALATLVNGALGTSYTSGSFHSRTSGDNAQQAGQGANDA